MASASRGARRRAHRSRAGLSRALPSDLMEESIRLAMVMQMEEMGVTDAHELWRLESVLKSTPKGIVQESRDEMLARQLWKEEVQMRADERLAVSLARRDHGIMTEAGFERQVSDLRQWRATSLKDGTTRPDALFECGVCLERLDRTKHQFHQLSCRHTFCLRCFRQYIAACVEQGNFDILCPDPECKKVLDLQRISVIMAGCGPVYETLQRFILEKNLRQSTLYCSNRVCSEPFVIHDKSDLKSKKTRVFTCPWCETVTCGQCKRGGHGDGPCPTDVDELDRLMRARQRREGWKECPRCQAVIAKPDYDCNFVRCRCSCAFCYRCSTPYRNTRPTAENAHGTPGCNCGLFAVPPAF